MTKAIPANATRNDRTTPTKDVASSSLGACCLPDRTSTSAGRRGRIAAASSSPDATSTDADGGLARIRVAIARALVGRPTVVFADEPTGNLDSRSSDATLELLRRTVDGYGQMMVMITHDPRRSDEILFLADGRIVKTLGRSDRTEVLAAMEVTQR